MDIKENKKMDMLYFLNCGMPIKTLKQFETKKTIQQTKNIVGIDIKMKHLTLLIIENHESLVILKKR